MNLSVLSPVSGKAIATLKPKADSFALHFTPHAIKTGVVFGPAIRHSIVNAALYLVRETAALSCTCDGYTVTK